ncbi:defective in cullin neddylation protein [Actinidia rufa]|uniref:Defective in cullin neddylation protein n=1 Tax=Actinidia rufa TaxID=165716 RepID=A0A7J0H2A1_9ERIC|nr:defective in cullin neddylation protein [Actinidia rufa]
MRRSSSRKGQTNSAASNNSSAADLFRSASGRAATKEMERIDNLFYTYANNLSGMIEPEGIEILCSDLEVDHTDVRVLMLAWKMKAEKQAYFTLDSNGGFCNVTVEKYTRMYCTVSRGIPGKRDVLSRSYFWNIPTLLRRAPCAAPFQKARRDPCAFVRLAPFTTLGHGDIVPLDMPGFMLFCQRPRTPAIPWYSDRFWVELNPPKLAVEEEWRRGLKALRADTITKLKKALPELEKEVKRPSNFVDFYSYAFRYCLTEEKQKSIDIESICQLLDLVLGSQFRAQVDYFVEYLRTQIDYKVINMDQWGGVLSVLQ